MTVSFCPVCDSPVEPQFRFCQSCGVDLALATVLAEDALASTSPSVILPVSPEILIPRLGENLVQRNVISEEELQTALIYQKEQESMGKPVLIGQALMHLGFLDRTMLDQAITAQIFDLQAALNRSNRDLEKRVKEYTSDLQRALQKLSELNQLKSNFVSNVSHELRTPLTHIKGYLELLADESLGPLVNEQSDALDVMGRAVERLENLINDLIKFSETAKGGLSLQIGNIAMDKIIQKVTAQNQDKAEQRELTLKCNVSKELPEVYGDEENITWVISQLVDNAIKFTNPGGKVTINCQDEGPVVVVSIIDTGIGIPQERIDEIFLPFHQLDNSPRRRHGGTGMGLSLVRRIIEAHNTEIKINSVLGKGSRFQFSLPISNFDQSSVPELAAEV